jgi:TolB-like protein/Flp pilus assembly protein TadD
VDVLPEQRVETSPDPSARKKQKRRQKVRSASISFVGRIVAQLIGAAATIFLGLYVIGGVGGRQDAADSAAAKVPAVAAAPVRDASGHTSLAVLPLDNFTGDPRQDYFADGMTEALIADLAQIKGLRVISRTSSIHYKGQRKTIPQIAQELGVDLIVEGSVAASGNRIRVTAQLIDTKSDEHMWARSYDNQARDVLTLQGRVAAAIAREVGGVLTSQQQQRLNVRDAIDPDVYELYLRGRSAWNERTPAALEKALRYFDQAIDRAPRFAPAYAGLADAYLVPGVNVAPPEADRRARAAAQRALDLDDDLAEAHASLAAVLHRDADVAAAKREFVRAIELNPGYATAHHWYAMLLAEEGRDKEATAHAERAVALDPLSGHVRQTMALVHYYGRRYEETIAEGQRALKLVPHLPLVRSLMGVSYVHTGQQQEASDIMEPLLRRDPLPVLLLARWYAVSGDREGTLTILERQYSARGNIQQHKLDPAFDAIREDQRFAQMLRRQSAVSAMSAPALPR